MAPPPPDVPHPLPWLISSFGAISAVFLPAVRRGLIGPVQTRKGLEAPQKVPIRLVKGPLLQDGFQGRFSPKKFGAPVCEYKRDCFRDEKTWAIAKRRYFENTSRAQIQN